MQRYHSSFCPPERFGALAARLAYERGADLFLSGKGFAGEHKHVIGIDPREELVVAADTGKDDLAAFCFGGDDGPALGFLSYTYGLGLRGVETSKESAFPLGHLKKYGCMVCYDSGASRIDVMAREPGTAEEMIAFLSEATAPEAYTTPKVKNLAASMERDAYVAAVEETLERIRAGYTYQLNLSIRFSVEWQYMSPAAFFRLWRMHPAPFYAWFASGAHRIASTSPERFLKVEKGKVLSQPIKGTLAFKEYTRCLDNKLRNSPKEDAELSMIVDLMRNDISTHCEVESVTVTGHKSTFVVDNLIQMYSNVRGTLREESDCLDLLLDAFPGGSVTGCPKQSSMGIIEELEPHARDIYCGAMVMIHDEKNMDSSIAIRTGYHDGDAGLFHFYAGSGIVAESNPAREYDETMAKAGKFLRLVKGE